MVKSLGEWENTRRVLGSGVWVTGEEEKANLAERGASKGRGVETSGKSGSIIP